VHRERIEENAAVFDFELSETDMDRIADFDENASVTPASWDPETSEKWR
jgi:diketogulonate reductase-like aldo/keto reductase